MLLLPCSFSFFPVMTHCAPSFLTRVPTPFLLIKKVTLKAHLAAHSQAFSTLPEDFRVAEPSLHSPLTSFALAELGLNCAALCCNPSLCTVAGQCRLPLPLRSPGHKPTVCVCGRCFDPCGNHLFSCPHCSTIVSETPFAVSCHKLLPVQTLLPLTKTSPVTFTLAPSAPRVAPCRCHHPPPSRQPQLHMHPLSLPLTSLPLPCLEMQLSAWWSSTRGHSKGSPDSRLDQSRVNPSGHCHQAP